MVMAIWKFPLSGPLLNRVPMPQGAEILSVQYQESEGAIVLWARVNIDAPNTARAFYVAPTGAPLPTAHPNWRFIGTVQIGSTVWHVFDTNTLE